MMPSKHGSNYKELLKNFYPVGIFLIFLFFGNGDI